MLYLCCAFVVCGACVVCVVCSVLCVVCWVLCVVCCVLYVLYVLYVLHVLYVRCVCRVLYYLCLNITINHTKHVRSDTVKYPEHLAEAFSSNNRF